MNTIGRRFKELREVLQLNQSQMAKIIGSAPSLISDIEREDKEPSKKVIISLLEKYNVNANWLLNNSGEMFLSETTSTNPPEDATAIQYAIKKIVPSIMLVDLYHVEASAGKGREVEEYYDVSKIPILEEFIFPYKAHQIKALIVKGDSMINARIFNNDIVFFSPEEKTGNGIFVISIGNEVFVKRIEFNPIDQLVRIISENEKYQPITVKAVDSDTLRINGRVIAVLHREL